MAIIFLLIGFYIGIIFEIAVREYKTVGFLNKFKLENGETEVYAVYNSEKDFNKMLKSKYIIFKIKESRFKIKDSR